jgi:phenylalanyl-tRNA synthetase alpha chain
MELEVKVRELKRNFEKEIGEVDSLDSLEKLRVKYLGRKGEVTLLIKGLKDLGEEDRRRVGALLNQLKGEIKEKIDAKRETLEEREVVKGIDLTLPGRRYRVGKRHPLIRVLNEIIEIFVGLGFEVVEGPDVEWDYYNFEALNIPPHHPARDMWSTHFITEKMLLRTHTSPVQIRTMEKRKPPLRILAPGRCFRLDPFDATHAPAFYQIEGLYVDRNVSFAELKGTLELFAKELFGPNTEVKFIPSYFPFTEPSAEVSVKWKGEWLEICGCGMVHPNVFRAVGYDPEEWTGYAFGLGPDRIAMIKLGVDDIRLFYENDVRFLRQF